MRLVLATRNRGKLREIAQILSPTGFQVDAMDDVPALAGGDVEETGDTFLANALIKAEWAGLRAGRPALADDSGLEVDALDGAPGIRSARYAGSPGDDQANNAKLVAELARRGSADRRARFRCTVVLFVPDGVEAGRLRAWADRARPGRLSEAKEGEPVRLEGGVAAYWTGTVEGQVIDEPRGRGGFGYDPHFLLPGLGMTTAQLPADLKNALSHRGQAFRKLAAALR
jgi:XTP/dITP diphosphohydrolase